MDLSSFQQTLHRKYKLLLVAGLILVTFITFYQTTSHDFISYDDQAYITENIHVKSGVTASSLKWAFVSLEISNWHPLTWVSHILDYEAYGLNPYGHHLTNVILHCANTALLFFLLYSLTTCFWQSLFVSGLFALHPLHVESVAWVAERKDLLSTMFMLLTMLSYARYVRSGRTVFYLSALLLFLLGLMSKPMLVSLPLLLLLLDYWPLGRFDLRPVMGGKTGLVRLSVEKLPFFVLSLISAIVTYYAQLKGGSVSSAEVAPVQLRIINALQSYLRYIWKTIWPHDLAIIYPHPQHLPISVGIVAAVILAAITYLVFLKGKKYPYLPVGWLWYVITLVPVIGLVQVGQQSMADRYTYIPLIGLFITTAWGITDLARYRHVGAGKICLAAILLFSSLTATSWMQLRHWKNSITLFGHAANVVPGNNIAFRILGNNHAKNGNIAEAIAALSQAVEIRKDDALAHTDLGVALAGLNRYDEAIYHYTAAIKLNPGLANTHYNYGIALANSGRYAEAVEQYTETLRLDPAKQGVRANMGAALFHAGRIDEAIYNFQEALKTDPYNDSIKQYIGIAINARAGRKTK